MENKILGALYGMAIGDAMGMPSELWGRKKVKQFFGTIDTFLDGPYENEVARNFKRGQFTDDTSQALIILDSLIENQFVPDPSIIARRLLKWADELNAFENEILGPSSKAALLAIKEGKDPKPYTMRAETNGAAMRIPPIGCLFKSSEREALARYVFEICKVTHATDVAISGASMVAMAVSAAIEDKDWDRIMEDVLWMFEFSSSYGAETFSASIAERLRVALGLAHDYQDDQEGFIQKMYDIIGSGVLASESVPTALGIAYYAKEPKRCSLLCANMGGDTDTIGAMATAICGAKVGLSSIDQEWIKIIDKSNQIDFYAYTDAILSFRSH